jgi:DNA-binding transcriptional regulator LsrR (DeoR family)
MEEEWIVNRAHLRELMSQQPYLTQRELAQAVGRSLGWVFDKQIVIQVIDEKRASGITVRNGNDRRKLIHLKCGAR